METRAFLDVHVLLWFYAGEDKKFSDLAKEKIENSSLWISPIALLEIDYLHEIKRFDHTSLVLVKNLETQIGLQIAEDNFSEIIRSASSIHWTRDVFDRILVAHAALHNAFIVTKDEKIRKHYKKAAW